MLDVVSMVIPGLVGVHSDNYRPVQGRLMNVLCSFASLSPTCHPPEPHPEVAWYTSRMYPDFWIGQGSGVMRQWQLVDRAAGRPGLAGQANHLA